MNSQERVRQTMTSKELTITEKRDQTARPSIPADVFKIEDLSGAMPAQLKGALEVAEALQQLNAAVLKKKRGEN